MGWDFRDAIKSDQHVNAWHGVLNVKLHGSSRTSLRVAAGARCLLVVGGELEVKRYAAVTSCCSRRAVSLHVVWKGSVLSLMLYSLLLRLDVLGVLDLWVLVGAVVLGW